MKILSKISVSYLLGTSLIGLTLSVNAFAEAAPLDCSAYGLNQNSDLSDPTQLSYELIFNYRQASYLPNDPMGDYALARVARATPRRIVLKVLRRKDIENQLDAKQTAAEPCATQVLGWPGEPVPTFENHEHGLFLNLEHLELIRNLKASPEDRERLEKQYLSGELNWEGFQAPFFVDRLKNMFVQIMIEEQRDHGIKPSFGNPHVWSEDFKKKYFRTFFPFSMNPKLLVALSRGETAKYMATGKEAELQSWVIEQPYRSISLDQMVRKSYVLNQGNVYLTLLTIENILAFHWRVEDREKIPVSLRLKTIQSHFGIKPDNYGAWYHLFGIMLYGFTTDEIQAVIVADTESLGSHILSRFEPENQEDYVNRSGAKLGSELRRVLLRRDYLKTESNPEYLNESYYLNQNEDFVWQLMRKIKRDGRE